MWYIDFLKRKFINKKPIFLQFFLFFPQSSGYGYGYQRQGQQQGYGNQNFYQRSDKDFYERGELNYGNIN